MQDVARGCLSARYREIAAGWGPGFESFENPAPQARKHISLNICNPQPPKASQHPQVQHNSGDPCVL